MPNRIETPVLFDGDLTWIASTDGVDNPATGKLLLSAFSSQIGSNGYIPSGIALMFNANHELVPFDLTSLGAPALTLGATAGTGGTGAAGTYGWKVVATNANGRGLASAEVTAVLAANGTQVLNWTAVATATNYQIWRRLANGTWTLVTTVGAVTTYTDTITAGTVGGAPESTLVGFLLTNHATSYRFIATLDTHLNVAFMYDGRVRVANLPYAFTAPTPANNATTISFE